MTNLNVDNDASLKAWGDAFPTLLTWGGVGKTLDLPEFSMAVRVVGKQSCERRQWCA